MRFTTFCGAHRLADHRKCFLPDLIVRYDVIGAIEVPLVNLLAWNERVDFDRVVALDCDGVEFIVVHRDVNVLRVLIPAPLVEALDWLARDLVDQLLPQPIAGFLVDLSKRDSLG